MVYCETLCLRWWLVGQQFNWLVLSVLLPFGCHVGTNTHTHSILCRYLLHAILRAAWLTKLLDCFPQWHIAASLPCFPFASLITHILTYNTHSPTGFHSFCFPFDFIYCSRSVLIYLCSLTSHSDNLLSCLPAPCRSLLILSNSALISVFLMTSFEVPTQIFSPFLKKTILCWFV